MRIVSAVGWTLLHVVLQAHALESGPETVVPKAGAVQAQSNPYKAHLDKHKFNHNRFTWGTQQSVKDESAGGLPVSSNITLTAPTGKALALDAPANPQATTAITSSVGTLVANEARRSGVSTAASRSGCSRRMLAHLDNINALYS